MPQTHLPSATQDFPRRILIVRLSAHGDVVHTLPLLTAIKEGFPTASIGWLVEASAAPLLENHPLIDHLHISHRKRWLKTIKNPLQWPAIAREVGALVQGLRQMNYDVSLDAQGLLKSAIWPWLAGIPKRLGYRASRESADRFYTERLAPMIITDGSVAAIERYLDLARALGCKVKTPRFTIPSVSDTARTRIESLLPTSDNSRPLIVLAPFTRWASKHWPMNHWSRLIQLLLQENLQLAILGAPADRAATEAMLEEANLSIGQRQHVLNLVGQTEWPDLYALFERTQLVIGLDSAPLHIANAVGVPELIGIYGPTAPGRTGPIGDKQTTLSTALSCQPCFKHDCPIKTHDCMRQLQPEQVAITAMQRLGRSQREGTP